MSLMKICLIIFAVFLFLVSIISVSATEIMPKEAVLDYKGHKITMLDVSEDFSCIFKIDDKTVVAAEHEEAKYNGVIVWVKDAVKMHSQGDNYCEFIITLEEAPVEKVAVNKTSKYGDEVKTLLEKAKGAAEAVDDKINLSINVSGIINKTNQSNVSIIDGIENAPIMKTEKSIIARFIEWIKELFD